MSEYWRRLIAERGTVRARLMLWNIAVMAVMLSILGVLIQVNVRKKMLTSLDTELAARVAGMPVQPPPPETTDASALSIFTLMPLEFNVSLLPNTERRRRHVHGLDTAYVPRWIFLQAKSDFPVENDKPWDKAMADRAAQGQDNYTTIMVNGEPIRVYSKPVRYHGQIIAVLQLPVPLTEVYRAIADMNATLLALVPVALSMAGVGGALLTRRALRPAEEMALAANHIGAGELAERLPIVGNDEFSQLATAFNQMLTRLETTFAQRERLVQRLQQSIEQERRFIADASHELKTPLTVIKANISLLLLDSSLENRENAEHTQGLNGEIREMLEDVNMATDTMSQLVYDLLLLARSDGGRLGSDAVEVPVLELLNLVRQRVARPNAACISVAVPDRILPDRILPDRILPDRILPDRILPDPILPDPILPDPILMLRGNREELTRLFCNLVANGLQYTPQDGHVYLRAQRLGDRILVQVQDTGIGIAPEHLPHLGERFYRVDAARTRSEGGTGLGLAICKGIVAAHNGTLEIASQPGQGTTVSITLPVA